MSESDVHENESQFITNVWLLLGSFALVILPWFVAKVNEKINQYQEKKPLCIINYDEDDQIVRKQERNVILSEKSFVKPVTNNVSNGDIKHHVDDITLKHSEPTTNILSEKNLLEENETDLLSEKNSSSFPSCNLQSLQDSKVESDLLTHGSVDLAGDSNNDTDTETITQETISESVLTEDNIAVENRSISRDTNGSVSNIDNLSSPNETVNESLIEVIAEHKEQNTKMAHSEDEATDEMHLATQLTIGSDSPSELRSRDLEVESSNFYPLDKQNTLYASPYVLRIDTGDENRDDVIHASPWIESSDSDSDEDAGIYKAKCIQLTEDEKILPATGEDIEVERLAYGESQSKEADNSVLLEQKALVEMEAQRRRIIADQVVRSRRIESWLHEGEEEPEETNLDKVQSDSLENAFIALPALVRSEAGHSQDEEEKDAEVKEGRKQRVCGGTNGDSFYGDTLFSLDMTSLVNEQPSSLEPEELNSHEPDSLDFTQDMKVEENETINENGVNIDNWNARNRNANEPRKPISSIVNEETLNGNPLSTGSWQEVHGNYIRETIVDREVRLALEREEEFRNEIASGRKSVGSSSETNNTTVKNMFTNGKLPSNHQKQNHIKPKIVFDTRNRDTVFTMENGFKMNGFKSTSGEGSQHNENPLESLIQREIRLQKEREQALAQERQMAQMAVHMRTQLMSHPVSENSHKNEWIENVNGSHEEEDKMNHKFKDSQDVSDGCELELMELNSDSENSHDDLVFHQRTESMDSLGSAGTPNTASSLSSEAPLPKRQVKVKPLVDEDNDQPSYQVLKESPIEREIRLAKEREETLRREKGLSSNGSTSPVESLMSANSKRAATVAASSWVRSRTLDLFNPTEQRDVQRRLATSRIQQEIEEQTQRELALRAAGSIKTTSEENVDAKVTRLTDLIEKSSKASVGSQSLPSTPDSELTEASITTPPSPLNDQSSKTSYLNKTNTLPHHGGRLFTKSTSMLPSMNSSTFPKRPICGAGKGVMQKFIASRGKVVPSFSAPREKSISTSQLNIHSSGYESSREQLMMEIRAPPPRNFKRQCSAETKIQEELQQMKAREEELKLLRAKSFAMSQPNLLSLIDDDIRKEESSDTGSIIQREKYSSNPNLLDDNSTDSTVPKMVNSKPPATRKRSALIAQWEEKIQQNSDN